VIFFALLINDSFLCLLIERDGGGLTADDFGR
jgi:hypothetical protein